MRRSATGLPRRVAVWILAALLGLGVAGLDIGAAAPQALTSNINNSVSTLTVAPPENVQSTSTINLVPLSCAVHVTWTAPTMTGIGGYEVRRVFASTNAELDPPSFTTDLFYDDDPTPLTVIGNAFEYQVRTVLDGTAWRSDWVPADAGVTVLCLNPLGSATESNATPDLVLPDAVEPDQPPAQSEPPTDVDSVPSTSIRPVTTVAEDGQPDSVPPTTSTTSVDTVPPTASVTTLLNAVTAVVGGS